MSLRRDLYRGRHSTPINHNQNKDVNEENNHWVRSWYDPPIVSKEDTITNLLNNNNNSNSNNDNNSNNNSSNNHNSNNSNNSTPLHNVTPDTIMKDIDEKSSNNSIVNDGKDQQLRGYEIKTWIINNKDNNSFKDYDIENNPKGIQINLEKYGYISIIKNGVNLGPKIKSKENDSNSNNNQEDSNNNNNNQNHDVEMNINDDDQSISVTDIKSAVGGSNDDRLFSSSATIGR